ncbi:glutaredoxin family protein [Nocardia huaxiensis]|uniref:Glutaredoxin family protein n=1 Tax=Nocardia huaxiensis TaxID=2755382 RepID=A0A7D6Z515_9NOCA|nr:glutaredoxin family protein [Nocardia huaxiensis]QLY31484.1 glutaredoxin family protein [Nocardia huaxiensis]UFS95035.1 glutaredoxin family protein [Nocardia huaxiensis]
MDDIVLYGADWCGDCRRAKVWLRENNVAFTEIDVEHDEVARERAIEISGRKNIPVIVLPDGTVLVEPTNAQLAAALGR